MALKLQKTYKGLTAEYWKITLVQNFYLTNKTNIVMALYFNANTRGEDVNNIIDIRNFEFDGTDFTRSQIYAKIKAPKIISELDENGEPVLDEYGVEVTREEATEFTTAEDLV